MTTEEFDKFFEQTVSQLREVLTSKGTRYANNADRFHNFKRAALILGGYPENALLGFMTKHWVNLIDLIERHDACSKEEWDEVITDLLNYLILLRAIVFERINEIELKEFPLVWAPNYTEQEQVANKWDRYTTPTPTSPPPIVEAVPSTKRTEGG